MISKKVDFDKHAHNYDKQLTEDLEFFGEESGYLAEYKIRIVKNRLCNNPLNILEYGCGIGRNLKYFSKYFPESNITGCDISAKSIGIAKSNHPDIDYFIINEENLAKHYGKFDLIFISCVFHHIEPKLRDDSIKNVYNLLRNKGSLFFFEHNPFNPLTQKIVKKCPWDTDAILLKPKESLILIGNSGLNLQAKKYTLFFPAFLKYFRFLEDMIWFLPFGGQYYIQAVKSNNK